MSEDENVSTSGGHQPNTDSHNSSLIGKVRSKVSNILPQNISKWFSPIRGGEEGGHNGNLRRCRSDFEEEETENNDDRSTDGSDSDNNEQPVMSMPPTKKSRLNAPEEFSERNLYLSSSIRTHDFLSSTPTYKRKKHLNLLKRSSDPPYPFPYVNQAQESNISRHLEDKRYMRYGDEDIIESDVLEVIPEHEPLWENSHGISSRRTLHIPSEMRRQTLLNSHLTENYQTKVFKSSLNVAVNDEGGENNEEENSEDGRNLEKMVLTNGGTSNVIEDTGSESEESHCSSLQKRKSSRVINAAGSKILRNSGSSGLNFYSHLEGKKSLFSDKNRTNTLNNSTISLTSLNRRQSFNASLYGSTSALSDSRLLNISSPFYKGRTTYGGASAYNKNTQHSQQQTLHRISRTPVAIRPSSSLSSLSSSNNSLAQGTDATIPISNTAKRILELMNQITTPLTDAKKMANTIKIPGLIDHKRRFNEEDLKQSHAIRMSMPRTPYSKPISTTSANKSKVLAPPTSELQVPTMANLLQIKKLQNNIEKIREIANASKCSLNAKEEYKLPATVSEKIDSDNNNKHVNKIKHKVSSRSSLKTNILEEETIPPVNLPEISLPLMKSVPKIDISINKPSNNQHKTVESSKKVEVNEISNMSSKSEKPLIYSDKFNSLEKKSVVFNNNSDYKFSNPVSVTNIVHTNIQSVDKYNFSEPIKVNSANQNSEIESKKLIENFKFIQPENSKEKNIKNQSENKNDTKFCAPQLKTGSVLDVLKKQSNETKNNSSFGDQFKMSNNQWECSVCMIRNNDNENKCVACQTKREKLIAVTTTSSASNNSKNVEKNKSTQNSFGDMFKPKENTWECPACMIQNENTIKECIACKEKKPGMELPSKLSISSSSSVPKVIKEDVGFKSLVAQQASKWECSGCMTYNEQTRSKCACCEQSKPGSPSNMNVAKPNLFGSNTNSKFVFGFGFSKDNDVKKDEEKISTVTSSNSFNNNKAGFSFGSNTVSSSTINTSQTVSQSLIGFKSINTSNKEYEKNVPDVSSSSFKSDTPETFSFGFKPISGVDSKILDTNTDNKSSTDTTDTAQTLKLTSSTTSSSNVLTNTNNEKKEIASNIFGNSLFSQKPDSTADSSISIKFGSSNKLPEVEKGEKSNLNFGKDDSSNKSIFSAFNSPTITEKSDELNKNKISFGSQINPQTTSTSVFGNLSSTTTTSNISSFGGTNSNNNNKINTTASLTTSTQNVLPFQSTSTSTNSTTFESTSPILSQKSNIFGSSFSASNTNNTQQNNNNQSSNLFSFGSTGKTDNSGSGTVFGSVSSTTNKPFTFGSNQTATTSSTPFVFGSTNNNLNISFPSSSKDLQKQEQTEVKSIFGQTSNINSPFGNTNSNETAFGKNTGISVFGSATPSFGSTGFGASNSTSNNLSFGSLVGSSTPTFGNTGFNNNENNSLKKPESNTGPVFNFGSSTQNTSSSGIFTFGATNNNNNNNTTQQPFNFQANATPSFNFTGSQETTSNAPFQFSAAGVNAVANFFAPTPTSGPTTSQQVRRKMRTRRNQSR